MDDLEEYLKKSKEGKLPEELEGFKHTIDWPINTDTSKIRFNKFYDENNYRGIDIQVKQGTDVFAPEDARVVVFKDNNHVGHKGLASIYLSADAEITDVQNPTGVHYMISNLDLNASPKKTRKRNVSRPDSRCIVKKGELIGKVGAIPDEKAYLYIEIIHRYIAFNPLLLFKKLK